jgi:hypothetical protein
LHGAGAVDAVQLAHEPERHVNARGDAGGGEDVAVTNVSRVLEYG